MSARCTPGCGWCGRCTAAWEDRGKDKHWSGRTQAAKALRDWFNNLPDQRSGAPFISTEDAYDAMGPILDAYNEGKR